MTRMTLLAALVLALAAAPHALAAPTPERVGPPNAMTAYGDSITRGFHTGGLLQDVPNNSWSTGGNTTVNSHFNRIRQLNPTLVTGNDGVTGARMNGFVTQVNSTPPNSVGYATVLLGANDACTSSESSMTPVATYRAQFEAGMAAFAARQPDARIYVVSVPNIYRLWEIGRNNLGARFAWSLYSICQSMLANASSTSATDEARRQRVRQRVVDFNTQLAEVCAQYLRCRFDGNTAFNTNFVLSDMSTIDYFHPNVAGQAKLAAISWGSSFDFNDTTAPTTAIVPDRQPNAAGWYADDVTVSLVSLDADLRGSEVQFRLGGAEGTTGWQTYGAPIAIDAEGLTEVIARSIDVNGNVEASKSLLVWIDRTAPDVSIAGCPTGPVLLGASHTVEVAAADGLSGLAADPSGTATLDTSTVGARALSVTARDSAGNAASATCSYPVSYAFGGVLRPIDAGGASVFRLGSTIPVKFQLRDAGGALVTTAGARLAVAKIADGVAGTEEAATSTAAATTGDAFRFADDQYVFNLATRGLTAGTYRLTVALDDGHAYPVIVSLR